MPGYDHDADAPTPNNPRAVGAAALIVRDGALLLDCRADDASWGLPAGRVEPDETVTEAVVREVREETGLEVVGVELFGLFSDPSRIVEYLDGNVFSFVSIVFAVEVADGEPVASHESRDVRFVPLDDLGSVTLFPPHRPVIDAFLGGHARPVVA